MEFFIAAIIFIAAVAAVVLIAHAAIAEAREMKGKP